MGGTPIREVDGGVEVDLLVVPNASKPGVVGILGHRVKVRVASPPERNKANGAVIDLMRQVTGARRIEITRGRTGRHKTVLLREMQITSVRSALTPDA